MKRRVVFRADGDVKIGYGHFIRTLGVADLIKDSFNCIYATKEPSEYQLREINKVCRELLILTENHLTEFLTYLKKDDIVVLDNYFFTSEYQVRIKELGCKVILIDDYNDKHYVCDALINNIPGFAEDSFNKEDYTKLYLGTDYALLRKEFLDSKYREIMKKDNSIFLSFGGGDFYNLSEKIVRFINEIDPNIEINLLIGDAFRFSDRLIKYKNINIHKNINASEVALLIACSSICIVPASSLLNEAASIGSKILIGYFADNQILPYSYFVENELAIGLGDYREVDLLTFKLKLEEVKYSEGLIENQKKIYRYQQNYNLKKIFYDI